MRVSKDSLQPYESDSCRLCGWTGRLSKTHVPPRGAGNQGSSRKGITTVDAAGRTFLDLSRPRDGGGWGRWFCTHCNRRCGRWEEEYIRWSTRLVTKLHDEKPAGARLIAELPDADPGAVVRAMWAWAFAVDSSLLVRYPQLAASIRSGNPVDPPDDVRLLLGATRSLRIWVVGQRGGYAISSPIPAAAGSRMPDRLWFSGSRTVGCPDMAVASPPFVVLLAKEGDEPIVDYFDTGAWLAEPAGQRRTVSLFIPMVRGFEAQGPLTLLTFEQLA
jgi:hypothetical protein